MYSETPSVLHEPLVHMPQSLTLLIVLAELKEWLDLASWSAT